MTLIKWEESLETGIGMIDAQHRILVDLINRLEDAAGDEAVSETAASILYNLQQYTTYHFSAEIEYMLRHGYPDLEAHEEQHRKFREELEGFEIDVLVEDPKLGANMLEFLRRWFVNHITRADMDFARYVGKEKSISA